MTDKEAMKLALEALESDYTFEWPAMHRPEIAKKNRSEAITAIKEALAQPEKEPVAWKDVIAVTLTHEERLVLRQAIWDSVEIVAQATPPQRTEQSGWRKKQIDDAEEEAWRELEKKNEST